LGRCFLNTETQRGEDTEEDQNFGGEELERFFKHRDTEIQRHREERTQRKTRFFGAKSWGGFLNTETQRYRDTERRDRREKQRLLGRMSWGGVFKHGNKDA
jgi:hypothetical protein